MPIKFTKCSSDCTFDLEDIVSGTTHTHTQFDFSEETPFIEYTTNKVIIPSINKRRNACINCKKMKISCSTQEIPCKRCTKKNLNCIEFTRKTQKVINSCAGCPYYIPILPNIQKVLF